MRKLKESFFGFFCLSRKNLFGNIVNSSKKAGKAGKKSSIRDLEVIGLRELIIYLAIFLTRLNHKYCYPGIGGSLLLGSIKVTIMFPQASTFRN